LSFASPMASLDLHEERRCELELAGVEIVGGT
jgi:hypothetical protein